MKEFSHNIDSPEAMVAAIRHYCIIPFFRNSVPGWSIEEMTPPEKWFYSSDELGPWDWKIEAVREGDIAYGKFLGGKAAFATVECYRHLMNWRRSLAKYRMALGEEFQAKTASDKLMQQLSPAVLSALKDAGSLESREMRLLCCKTSGQQIKKNVVDSLIQFLNMGTWIVIGDFTRVYRGPNLEYKGWQRSSFTTPDELFCHIGNNNGPSWARFIDSEAGMGLEVNCTPEESREFLINHVLGFFPDCRKAVEKAI